MSLRDLARRAKLTRAGLDAETPCPLHSERYGYPVPWWQCACATLRGADVTDRTEAQIVLTARRAPREET